MDKNKSTNATERNTPPVDFNWNFWASLGMVLLIASVAITTLLLCKKQIVIGLVGGVLGIVVSLILFYVGVHANETDKLQARIHELEKKINELANNEK